MIQTFSLNKPVMMQHDGDDEGIVDDNSAILIFRVCIPSETSTAYSAYTMLTVQLLLTFNTSTETFICLHASAFTQTHFYICAQTSTSTVFISCTSTRQLSCSQVLEHCAKSTPIAFTSTYISSAFISDRSTAFSSRPSAVVSLTTVQHLPLS